MTSRVRGLTAATTKRLLIAASACQLACSGGCNRPPDDPGVARVATGVSAVAAADLAERYTTWKPGIPGGIPVVTTVHTTIDAAAFGDGRADAAASINAAIRAAGDAAASTRVAQVVYLPPGTYRTAWPIEMNRSDVVLRGAGAERTRIVLDTAEGVPAVRVGRFWPEYRPGDLVDVVGDVPKGSTAITVADAGGIEVGDVLQIDQEDDTSYVVLGDGTYFKRGPGSDPPAARWRSVGQQIEVASKDRNMLKLSGPTHVAFHAAFSPQVFKTATARSGEWGTRFVGLEDLYVTGGNNDNITFLNVAYGWVRDVESDGDPSGPGGVGTKGHHISLDRAYRCEIRGSYVHHARSIAPGGGAYGITVRAQSSDNLIEDNVAYMLNKPIVMIASGGGNVVAYNYADQGVIAYAPGWQETTLDGGHTSFPHHELFEGNWSANLGGDTTHGNSGWLTFFRNYARGRNSDDVAFQNVHGANATGWSWNYSYVGNVLLHPDPPTLQGYRPIYESSWDGRSETGNLFAAAAFRIGNSAEPDGAEWDDGTALATVYRHGNFDYVTNAVAWDAATPDHTLPDSLYLSAKPAFFGELPWPWVDPSGPVKVRTLPAKARFDAGRPTQSRSAH